MSETEAQSPAPAAATDAAPPALVVPEWALRARAFLRQALVVAAVATALGVPGMIVGVVLGMREYTFLIPVIPFACVFLISFLQIALLVVGFVQYSLGELLKLTLIGAACMSAVVAGAHWLVTLAGVVGLICLAFKLLMAATHADMRQK